MRRPLALDDRFVRGRAVLPVALVLVSLFSLALLPMWTMKRTGALRDRVGITAEPARTQVTRIQNAIALESAATRSFLLTGDSAAPGQHFAARANLDEALARLELHSRALGADVRGATAVLAENLRDVEALFDSLFAGTLTRAAYVERLPQQQHRLEETLRAAAAVDRALGLEVAAAMTQARTAERIGAGLSIAFVLMAFLAAALVASLTRQLRNGEERFRQIAEAIQDFVWLSDTRFRRYLFANQAFERITGRSRTELYADPGVLLEAVHPEDRDRVRHAFSSLQSGPHDIEFRMVRPQGDMRWVWSRGFPIADTRGAAYRIAGIAEDITERKLANDSRVRLIRGFTHDVKNPLGAADGHLALLQSGLLGPLSEKQLESLGRSRGSIKAALNLIVQLLDIARAEAGQLVTERKPTDVAALVSEVVEEFRASASARKQSIALSLPDARGDEAGAARSLIVQTDPGRVRQVLANLVSNAVKYTQPEGHIVVSARLQSNGGTAPKDSVVAVTVSDDGPGIPYDKQNMLFREFTRFSPSAVQGSGIGLAISQRVASALDANITFKSTPGAGSSFTLWLPADARSGAY